jgi:hypothetical protein
MSKYKHIYLGSFVLILFVIYGIFISDISIHEEFPAVKYRLGEEGVIENITIKIDGTYSRSIFSDDIFSGSIYIEGYDFTNDKSGFSNLKSTLADIHIDRKGYGMYNYVKINSNRNLEHLFQGEIFVKDKFSMITMTIEEEKSSENLNGGWNSGNGILISGPAETRKEALAIANLLMKDLMLQLK